MNCAQVRGWRKISWGFVGVMALLGWTGWRPPCQAAVLFPDAIAGLQAWYRVDQGVTTSGTEVTGWQDSSGLGRHMSQATSAYRPAVAQDPAGFPVVRFDGSNDYLTAGDQEVHSNTAGLTIIGLVNPRSVSAGLIASKFQYAANGRAWRLGTDWFDVQENPSGPWNSASQLTFAAGAKPTPNQWNLVTGSWTPGQSAQGYLVSTQGPYAFQERYAGAASLAVPTMGDTIAALMLGANNAGNDHRLSGDLAEVLVYNRALGAAERQGLIEYFQQKYAAQTLRSCPLAVDINFEGTGANAHDQPLPPSYRVDAGQPFTYQGDGLWYGWNRNVAHLGRNRNAPASPDERFDTLMHMYEYVSGNYVPGTWQLAVPDGTYWVRAVFGESSGGTSTNHVLIQGTAFNDRDPGLANDWDEYFGQFVVTGGRLTIAPQNESPAKIAFMQLWEATDPQIAINFEGTGGNAHNGSLPPNYLIDNGAAFGDRGNGFRYGWLDPATGNPLLNPHGRNRNSVNSPDERYDTLNHLWNGGSQHYNWEIELPGGRYFVLAVFGESSGGTAIDDVWIENTRFFDPDPNLGNDWDLFLGTVELRDGRLTLGDLGLAQSAKVAFLEITAIPEPSAAALAGLGLVGVAAGMLSRHARKRGSKR